MRFRKKVGEVGWPGPQAKQIEGWLKAWSCDYKTNYAQTGSIYFNVEAPSGKTIKVRIADHADAYATSDFSIDPVEDMRVALKRWLAENGTKKPRSETRASNKSYIMDIDGSMLYAIRDSKGAVSAWEIDEKKIPGNMISEKPIRVDASGRYEDNPAFEAQMRQVLERVGASEA